MVHSGDVGVDLDRDASLAQQPHGRNSIFGAFLNRLKQCYQEDARLGLNRDMYLYLPI